MHFVLLNASGADRAAHAARLTKNLMRSFSGSDQSALENLLSDAGSSRPAMVAHDALPTPSPSQEKEVKALQQEALSHLNAAAPLLPGETVEADVFSLLAEPYGDYRRGTAVLHRRTSLAEYCFFFPSVTLVAGGLRVMPPATPDIQTETPAGPLGAGSALLLEAAKKLAEMLGTALLNELFPEKMPPYFNEAFAKIEKIVASELMRQTVDEVEGEFGGVLRFVKNEYEPEKDTSGVTPELLRRLQDQADRMYAQVGRVMPERFSMHGLPIFQFGATVHLMMLQELAIQRHKLDLLSEKPSAKTFEDYAKHAEETWKKLDAARRKGSVGLDQRCSASGGGGGVVCRWFVYWQDDISKARSGEYAFGCGTDYENETAARKAAKTALDKHLANQVAALKTALDDPPALAAAWRAAGKALPG